MSGIEVGRTARDFRSGAWEGAPGANVDCGVWSSAILFYQYPRARCIKSCFISQSPSWEAVA